MGNIIRIFIVNDGRCETFAFRLDAFVSYNIDTHYLTLVNGSVFVHHDSEERLIRAYRLLEGDDADEMGKYYEEFDRLKEENMSLRREIASGEKYGFFKKFRK